MSHLQLQHASYVLQNGNRHIFWCPSPNSGIGVVITAPSDFPSDAIPVDWTIIQVLSLVASYSEHLTINTPLTTELLLEKLKLINTPDGDALTSVINVICQQAGSSPRGAHPKANTSEIPSEIVQWAIAQKFLSYR
jgi:hypothetical protein